MSHRGWFLALARRRGFSSAAALDLVQKARLRFNVFPEAQRACLDLLLTDAFHIGVG
jgi:hypothetical protein